MKEACIGHGDNCEAIRAAVNDPNWLQYYLRKYRTLGACDSRFDFLLIEGQIKEAELQQILNGHSVEVKRDYIVSRSGNVAIELKEGDKDTGLSVTESDWYAIVLDGEEYEGEVIVMVRTHRLKAILASGKGRERLGGSKGKTLMRLLPLQDLFAKVRNFILAEDKS